MGILDRFISNKVNKSLLPAIEAIQLKSFNFLYRNANSRTANYLDWGVQSHYLSSDSIYTIIRKRVQKEASIPFFCYKKKDAQSLKRYLIATKGQQNIQSIKKFEAYKKKALSEITVDNEFTKLLQKPNNYQGSDTFFQVIYTWYAYKGEAFIWKNRWNKKEIVELLIIPPNLVELEIDKDDWYNILSYKVTIGSKIHTIPKEDIIHWKSANIESPNINGTHLRGFDPLKPLNARLQHDRSLTDQAVYGAENKGADGAVSPKDFISISPQQETQFADLISRTANNVEFKKAISFMPMPFEFVNFGRSNDEMQLMDQLGWTFDRLCHAFGVPPVLFNTETQYANLQFGQKNWVLNDVMSVVYSLRDELNRSLAPEFGGDIITDADFSMLPEMQEDIKMLVDAYLPLVKEGIINADEMREVTSFDPSGNPTHSLFFRDGTPIEDMITPAEDNTNSKWNDYEGES